MGPKHIMNTYIIAEAGVNHNGSAELAHQLVDAAADAGVDAVKFQTFIAMDMTTETVAKAEYQDLNCTKKETQYEMLSRLELDHDLHHELKKHAEERQIDFLSTAFDNSSLKFLTSDLSLGTMKISSGELTNHPFLLAHAKTGSSLILSTGMATVSEIEDALAVIVFGFLSYEKSVGQDLDGSPIDTVKPSAKIFKQAFDTELGQKLLKQKLTLLHCTSEYPTSLDNVNLRAMQFLGERFKVSVGYSDHTLGVEIASLAVAAGAVVLEKHFTLDRGMSGPDHAMSLSPEDLTAYVEAARVAERVMGVSNKCPTNIELENRVVARKVIVATRSIAENETLTESNVGLKRGGEGLEPNKYWDVLGKRAAKPIQQDIAITDSLIE